MEGVLLVSAAIFLLGGLLALVKGQSRGRTLTGMLRKQAIHMPNRWWRISAGRSPIQRRQ
jgi:hypothetical protein